MALTTSEVDLSLQQFIGAWRLMCSGGPRYSDTENGGVHYIFSGVPISFFNVAILTEPFVSADALSSAAQQAYQWASSRDVP